jgi:hypothetical protein
VFFNDTYTSAAVAFRTMPCTPGQMQAPALVRRDRTLLKVSMLAAADREGGSHAGTNRTNGSAAMHSIQPPATREAGRNCGLVRRRNVLSSVVFLCLQLKWNLPDETGGEAITQYQLKVKPLPQNFAGSEPDGEVSSNSSSVSS